MATLRFPENISTSAGTYIILTRHKSQGYKTEQLRDVNQSFIKTTGGVAYGLPVPNELSDLSTINYNDIQDSALLDMPQEQIQNAFGNKAQMASMRLGSTTPALSTMLFNGVQVKNFTFSWDLIPETPAEGNSIVQIIQGLEEAKLPYFESMAAVSRLKFPDVFQISFGGVQPKLIRYGMSFITSVEVDYSSGHFQLYSDGNFPQIKLRVGFTELVARTREMQTALYKRAN